MKIPQQGLSRDELFRKLEEYRSGDFDWRTGRSFAYVYDPGEEALEVIKETYMKFLSENCLYANVYPSVIRFENELVAMGAEHLRGDADVVGSFTSGGTESVLLAVKTARDYFRARKPEIKEPEMILPVTAHGSFHKAAEYFCVKKVLVPVDPVSFKADVDAVRRAITPNTILLVASAPSFAHGVVDPMREIGQVALEHGLLFHVDACVGGFMLPYFRRLGAPVPDFDFSVPGVTSISMDLHKYAFAAKGASLILYRNKDIRYHQFFMCAEWTGYTHLNTTIQSTKSAGPLAAAWAVVNFIGDDGYLERFRSVLEATRKICDTIDDLPDLRLLGRTDSNMIAFTSDTVSVFHLWDELIDCGWHVQAQFSMGSAREHLHMSINPANCRGVDGFLSDLRACVEKVKGVKFGEVAAEVKEKYSRLNPSEFGMEHFVELLTMAGVEGAELPDRWARINEMLDALSPPLRERLLGEYLNVLYH
ncbi:MAG: aspartate aminotransferase family protein [Candidatus Abyssobacteria bacterium SURF_17]|uniref:Aspartate aminotransferase family protein n=1 Tax=Candidatus Abyssobacteria bacterium SURF_17 TaxID=2093361 RepID=A0A419F579_9BACT|nr:MAG: aspartate aminotransferase family protein [Candidatus Abyssubacteria bacterium SURF_17]